MYYIAIDTSNNFSLGLFRDDILIDKVLYSKEDSIEKRENISDIVLKEIEGIFIKNRVDIDSLEFVSVIRGAGFFTGVRIGIIISKMLKIGLGIDIVSFSASFVMAKGVLIDSDKIVITTTDIGKTGAVIAIFDNRLNTIIEDVYVDKEDIESFFINNIKMSSDRYIIVGSKQGIFRDNEYFSGSVFLNNIKYPSVEILGQIGLESYKEGSIDELLTPLYAKDVDMKIKFKSIKGR